MDVLYLSVHVPGFPLKLSDLGSLIGLHFRRHSAQ